MKFEEELEKEIEAFSESIKNRIHRNQGKIEELEEIIVLYTQIAWGFIALGFIIIGVGLYLFTEGDFISSKIHLLGDFFGGTVASTWSLAGLFFIYVAFIGQKQQLLNQQIEILYSQLELKLTRYELNGQREEMTQQNATLKQQRFDNTFFQLLNTLGTIIEAMDLRKSGQPTFIIATGRDCFKNFYQNLEIEVRTYKSIRGLKLKDTASDIDFSDTIERYHNFFEKNQNNLGHYFRSLYHIIKFVDGSEIENKRTYTSIVRAQLSSHELALLFYNGLSDYGKEKFKPLIIKYALLKNLNDALIFNQEHLKEYPDGAKGH